MSFLSDEERNECKRIFNSLDKNKDNKLNINQVILGLGLLGKTCTYNEQKKIESKSKYYDLDSFINLCAEKVNFKNIDTNIITFFKILECKEKPGYISNQNLVYLLKKFEYNVVDKEINDFIKEIGDDQDGYINIEVLVRGLLLK